MPRVPSQERRFDGSDGWKFPVNMQQFEKAFGWQERFEKEEPEEAGELTGAAFALREMKYYDMFAAHRDAAHLGRVVDMTLDLWESERLHKGTPLPRSGVDVDGGGPTMEEIVGIFFVWKKGGLS